MRNGDGGGLDPRLEQRLRDELDQVQPRFSSPRYLSTRHRPAILRLAPAVLAATVLATLGLTAYTRSVNPVVWTESVVNVVHPATPTPQQTPAEHHESPKPTESPERHQTPEPSEKPEPHESPEPSGSPEPHESPEPSDGGGGSSGGGGSDGTSDSGEGERS